MNGFVDPGQQCHKTLAKELDYFARIRTYAVLLTLKGDNTSGLARILRSTAQKYRAQMPQLWFRISLPFDQEFTWETWYSLRKSLEWSHCSAVSIIFELSASAGALSDEALKRWMGESVAGIRIPSECIKTTSSNCQSIPTNSSKYYQTQTLTVTDLNLRKLIKSLMGTGGEDFVVILSGHESHSMDMQMKLVASLWSRRNENKYEEWLQGGRSTRENLYRPMQPLVESLPSAVYETFESDLVKYEQYLIAIRRVLQSFVFSAKNSPVVMVLGGGRGGLVKALWSACQGMKESELQPRIYVVEKNINCIPGLNYLNDTKWNSEVNVINADMRRWCPPEKADLVISELLGGFSDNELSPECLDFALHLMKDSCVSIPCWYRSVLLPVMAPRMVNSMRRLVGGPQRLKEEVDLLELGSAAQKGYYCDKLWVSRVYNRYCIDKAPQEVFSFCHPQKNGNKKYGMKQVKFRAKIDCELSGFLGLLDVCLHESRERNVYLSTVPKWHTPEMTSWYPTFIPLSYPVKVKRDEEIVLNMWRLSDSRRVWYEWALQAPAVLPIQNQGGLTFNMPLH